MNKLLLLPLAFLALPALGAEPGWKAMVEKELPRLGHRNWIVIADSAYPLQSGQGIETAAVEGNQVEVVREVLDLLKKSKHVRPVVHLDAELPFVPEAEAKGISAYRQDLAVLLKEFKQVSLPHEEIIGKLDKAGKTFKVLIIKTPLALPYTSVFLELDCGYWGAEQEKKLRQAILRGNNGKR
ncbi:MAG: hypothetical protein EXR99_05020 [Gemmataceae bacterium]|nr:hypothetical protein [Gemmataceae bacterium]